MTCSNNATLNVKAGSSKLFLILIFLLHFQVLAFAQKSGGADSLVRLLDAQSAHLLEVDGVAMRKVIGPATFLHNNTYLKCDSALWNVNTNIIDAIGNVQIIQENTTLASDRIEYVANENLAKVRGGLVQLMDKDGNILNTNYLNYNTKDSIATFFNGAALKNNDGNLIESINGMYFSKDGIFSFRDSVQMYTDSVFIATQRLDYHTETDVAAFKENTVAWKDSSMLFANSGNFHRRTNLFDFDKDGYIFTPEQELWADRLMYYRNTGNADLYRNVQVLDTVNKSIAMADKVIYRPDEEKIELTESPVVAMYFEEEGKADTLFLAANLIRCYSKVRGQIDSLEISAAEERLSLSGIDPIAIHDNERKAARKKTRSSSAGAEEGAEMKKDTVLVQMQDSLQAAPATDTSKVNFIDAFHNVRFYRSDVQGKCDSLVYTGIDSMARFYSRPVMWQAAKNQFSADSIQAQIKNGSLKKINLLDNAFIISQEDTVHYNQIKSTEMAAWFKDNELYRFDALGGVTALFYMQEDSVITLLDREECKMMTVKIKDNEVQRTRSIGELKQNVFPVYNLPMQEQRLKGFEWRGEERPLDRFDITDRKIRESRRALLKQTEKPSYRFTRKYFPQLGDSVLEMRKKLLGE